MSSKSKMLGWIKKKCRRRSDPFGDKLKYSEEKDVDTPDYFTLEIHAKPTPNNDNYTEENIYEEISDVRSRVVPSDFVNQMDTLTKNIEHEFDDVQHQICPICRADIPSGQLCTCVNEKFPTDTDENIYELAIDPCLTRSSCIERVQNNLQNQTNVFRTLSKRAECSSGDDSSGYYESVGSDYNESQVYSIGSEISAVDADHVTKDDDDGYEEIEFKPTVNQKRRYSVGSLPLLMSPSAQHLKRMNIVAKGSKTISCRGSLFKVNKRPPFKF